MRLHAKFTDGEYYSAKILQISESKKWASAPVEVQFLGYEDDGAMWLPTTDLKSKHLPKKAAPKASKAAAEPTVDFSKLEVGMVVQALSEGKWYAATVLAVSKSKAKADAPIKVNFVGYTSDSDEWVGTDRLRSKALKGGAKAEAKARAKAPRGPRPALQAVPILRRLGQHAAKEIPRAIVESSAASELRTMSYKDLLSNVQANHKVVAGLLAGRKDGLPKHVAYLVQPSMAYVIVELSVWAAGAACVPLSVHSPVPELEYFVQDSEAALLIADEASSKILKTVAETQERTLAIIAPTAEPMKYVISTGIEGELAEGDVMTTMQSNALILFTSGTTGKPKGVVHTFRSLSAQYASLSQAWKWSSKDYTLHVLPLHHIHGVQNILNTALYNGAGVELTHFDAAFCLKRICSGDVTCFHAVPTIYVKFTQHYEKQDEETQKTIREGLRNESLRYMVSGSAALAVPTMKSWATISGHVLLERYGMTEIGMGLSNKINGTRYPGCVGWPLPQARVKLDEEGGILIKGPLLFKEYYKREEATQKEFTEDGWFRTGDNCQIGGTPQELQAMQDDAREVEAATGRPRSGTAEVPPPELAKIHKIMGRSSVDIIKSGGYKISALEIEGVLLLHEAIKECAVIGKPDAEWGEVIVAFCALEAGKDLDIKQLREWGKEKMATYKVPKELRVLDELPRNQMGKLEKKKLVDMLQEPPSN